MRSALPRPLAIRHAAVVWLSKSPRTLTSGDLVLGAVMDIEDRLRALESRYRKALSASIGAKAHYLARLDQPNSTPAAIRRARVQWENLDGRRRELAGRMGEIEDAEGRMMV
jgi:hypothetical protein